VVSCHAHYRHCCELPVLCCAPQVSHRHSVLTAMRGAHAQVQAVRIPDLHAANLFLQVGGGGVGVGQRSGAEGWW
jgi:hypothetical protein